MEEAVTADGPRLVLFRTAWCRVCHEKAPVAEQIAREMGMELDVHDLEHDPGAALGEAFRITTVPTLALVQGGRARFKLVGAMITPENVAHLVSITRRPGEG
jgi:thioredoxin 1